MDENANKMVVIATGLFISIAIVTGALISINAYTKSYQILEENKFGIIDSFAELEKYNNTNLRGIDALNAAKKYWRHKFVIIEVRLKRGATTQFSKDDTDDAYERKVADLRKDLEGTGPQGFSNFNKNFLVTLSNPDKPDGAIPYKGKIDTKVKITFKEV
ncbi:MAG: hypothetical protein RR922_01180 [Clostridia bacterium]